MSKQSEAKAAQGYTTEKRNCGNCAHLVFDMSPPKWMLTRRTQGIAHYTPEFLYRNEQECGHRCEIGGFAIKKTATCQHWQAKPATTD